jgi:hypothetical protein
MNVLAMILLAILGRGEKRRRRERAKNAPAHAARVEALRKLRIEQESDGYLAARRERYAAHKAESANAPVSPPAPDATEPRPEVV